MGKVFFIKPIYYTLLLLSEIISKISSKGSQEDFLIDSTLFVYIFRLRQVRSKLFTKTVSESRIMYVF